MSVVKTSSSVRSTFLGDVLKLVSGTALAQILSIVASPFLTRLYAPEAFGALALFTSITSIVGVVVCLRYELAIMLPESDEEAANLMALSLGIAALISLSSIPVVWLARSQIATWLNAPELARYLWLVPPTLFFGGLGVGHPALNYWASRTRRFKELSITQVIGSIATNGIKLGAGFAGQASTGSLIGASVIGSMISPLALAWQIWQHDAKLFIKSISLKRMLYGLKRHRKFPFYSTWSSLLNTISWQLPSLLLGAFFSSTIVGYYALGFRIFQIPMNTVGRALGQVFFQRAAEAKTQGTLTPLVEGVFRRLVIIGLFPMLMIAIIGREFYILVFGANWAEAGTYTQILGIWTFFWFISSPMSTLFSTLERQEFDLKLNLILLLTRFMSLSVGGYLGNARLALLLFAITGTLVYGYQILAIVMAVNIEWSKIWNIFSTSLLYFIPFGATAMMLKINGVNPWVLIVSAMISVGFYFLILWKKYPDLLHINR